MINPTLLKQIRTALEKRAAAEKKAFVPMGPQGAAPAAPPMDPSMGGGMPPGGAPPMDPSMAGGMPPGMPPGGAPPMDPSMMGGGMPPPPPPADPAAMGGGGGQVVQVNLADLMQLVQMMQGGGGAPPSPAPGAAAGGAPGGAPAPEGEKPKGGGKDAKIDMVNSKLDQLIGLLTGMMGVSSPGGAPAEAGAMPEPPPEAAAMPPPPPPGPSQAAVPPMGGSSPMTVSASFTGGKKPFVLSNIVRALEGRAKK